MKVRWTGRAVRVRIDDLELAGLARGETLTLTLGWPGGGWRLTLDPAQPDAASGQDGALWVGLAGSLPTLLEPGHEGVRIAGEVPVTIEKDFGPEHLG